MYMVIAKKWGSSIGVILPKEMVEKQHIKIGDELDVKVFKKGDLSSVFGKAKSLGKPKLSGQEFKNMIRAGWESNSDKLRRR